MGRQSKQTPDQKKDTHKKKTHQPSTKKSSESAIWPCRINGCNKQFAREADLKRHQRTTKLHSVPSFACPQCDARFTRTDALRRHQKSRHNGVVIEPADDGNRRRSRGDDHPHSSGSRSKSRSRSPSSKESPVAPGSLPPTTGSPGGPQSYYRQHTFTGVMIPPPGMTSDGHYSPAAGPTPTMRLHQATWQPPPWGDDGSQPPSPHLIPPGYSHPYYNAPPQYYRHDSMMPSSDVGTHQQIPNGVGTSSNGESSLSSPRGSPALAVDPSLDHTGMEDPPDNEASVIDPSLVSPPPGNVGNGVSATNGSTPRVSENVSSPGNAQHISPHGAGKPPIDRGSSSDREAAVVQRLLSPTRDRPYASPHSAPLDRPLEMEQILTEDGEPMLNPAELLTQVSTSNATSMVLDLMLQTLS